MNLLRFSEQAYVHKLNANELGYRNGEPGKAGRFFLIAKTCIGYFPPLSEVVLNDHVLLDLIPPHNNDVVLTKYVYHNSKTATADEAEDRDEYRIYLNTGNDPGRDYYKPEDIILIVKVFEIDDEGEEDFLYKVVHIKPGAKEYERLDGLLKAADPRRGTHALIAMRELTFIEALRKITIGAKVIPDEIIQEALQEPIYHAPETAEQEADTTRIIRSRSFRDLVLYFYNYQCAVTGKNFVIDHKDFCNLEAAHLLARASGGGSNPSNGMALERNLHWAFDKGFFTVTPEYKIQVHPAAMRIPYLADKHEKGLIIPEDSRSQPNLESLSWHRENVFGLFLKTEI